MASRQHPTAHAIGRAAGAGARTNFRTIMPGFGEVWRGLPASLRRHFPQPGADGGHFVLVQFLGAAFHDAMGAIEK